MTRPLSLLAAILFIGACASSQVTRPEKAAPTSVAELSAAMLSEAAAIEDFESHVRIEFLEDGQVRRTRTERYTLLTGTPSDRFANVDVEFDPAQESPPLLAATVTLPDGAVRTLDPATASERAIDGAIEDHPGARRRLVAPLPALVPGARIEREIVWRSARPSLQVGRTFSHPLALPLPAKALSFVVDRPADLTLHARVLETELAPERIERDGRILTTWRRDDVPAFLLDPSLPPEERRFPLVRVSTASDWAEVVRAYHAAAAPRLTSKALARIARELDPASSSPRDVATAALEWMHHHLGDSGLDFNRAGLLPAPPEETLQRGRGDSKDLAAFLVALLNQKGVPAQLVLVQADHRHEADDTLAGLDRFTHVLVKVVGAEPLWIDPTLQGLPVGTLGALSMARPALVVDPSTTSLTRTPVGAATDNRAVVRTEVHLPAYGKGTLKTVTTRTGTALGWSRSRAQHASPEAVNEELARYVARAHETKDFTYRHSDPLSGRIPFEETLEIRNSSAVQAVDQDAVTALAFDDVLEFIPEALHDAPEMEVRGEAIAGPVFVGAPQTLEMVTRVHVHPLFELLGGPVSRGGEVGAVRWSYTVKVLDDGAEARLEVTFGDRVIPADQAQKVRATLQQLFESDNSLEFGNRPMRLLSEGKLTEAVRELRKMERAAPNDALIRSLLGRAAMAAGLVEEAHTLAREARDLGPMQPPVARTVGWILSVGTDGVEYGVEMPRAEALAALQRARRLEPEELAARDIEIQLLARDAEGRLGGAGSDLDTALEVVRTIPPAQTTQELGELHALVLFEAGHDRALIEATGLPDSDGIHILRFAARTRAQGPKAALTWLEQQGRGGVNDQLLSASAFMLFKARAYPEARALSARVRDPAAAQFSSLIDKAVVRDDLPFDPTNPVDIIIEGMAHAMRLPSRIDAKTLNLQEGWAESVRKELSGVFQLLQGADVAMLDALRGSATAKVTDLPGVGALVTLTTGFGGDLHLLERHGKGYRFHPHFGTEPQERAAWEALAKGDLQTVRSWLTYWTRQFEKNPRLAVPADMRELMNGDRAQLTLALSVLAPPPSKARAHLDRSLRALEQAWKSRDPKDLRSRSLSRQYVMALSRAGQHDQALEANATARQERIYDQDLQAFLVRAVLLREAGRDEALVREGTELMQRPDTRMAGASMRLFAARQQMDAQAYRDLNLEMASADIERLGSLNNAAWSALFFDRIEDVDIQRAEQALGPKADSKAALDTLAVLLAQRGEIDRAVVTLARLRGDSLEPETAPSVRYARGRIAEELGFTRAARALYRDIPTGEDFNNMAVFAQQRLKVLAQPRQAPAPSSR